MQEANLKQYLSLELLWWVLTAIVAFLVVYPITSVIRNFPFLNLNLFYVITFITVTRYLFLLKYTFLAKLQTVKVIIVFLFIPFIFYQVQELNHFQTFLDEQGVEALVGNLPLERQQRMERYVHSEIHLFGVGAIISSVIFPIRLIISVWRYRNRKTV